MRVGELHHDLIGRLRRAMIPDPDLEAALLMGHVLGMSRTRLLLAADSAVAPAARAVIEQFLARRLGREPLAYILGEWEFWSLAFTVSPAVLIPRPETELLVEQVLAEYREQPEFSGPILDLGTGSGILAVVLAREFPRAMVYGVDRSPAALAIAAHNAQQHRVADRVRLLASSWGSGLAARPRFELIVANPPYVESRLLDPGMADQPGGLQREVVGHEPLLALNGGTKGMDCIERIAGELAGLLRPGGWFFMEIGADQEEMVRNCFQSLPGFEDLDVVRDYAGLPRVFRCQRTEDGRRKTDRGLRTED
ncbi:MAG: peptide chain release factor N(5)-glutamine methyltransferase [Desulfobacterales bacterium]|nr:peptide chain release factor N(5)-glutamine methyltransferase [Desulfobacterales bacterium]